MISNVSESTVIALGTEVSNRISISNSYLNLITGGSRSNRSDI